MNRFQIFAEEAEEQTQPEKKYTDEDVNRIIDEKFAKWEKARAAKEAEKIEQAKEAEKLKNMSESEKTNQRLEELEAQLSSYKAREAQSAMEKEARKMFQAAQINVPDAVVSLCACDKAEDTKDRVDALIQVINDEVKRRTKDLVGKAEPKTGSHPKVTKEQILAVKDTSERQRLMAEHWDLFGGKKA